MTELAPGAYEHVVTAGLARRLRLVDDDLVQRMALDPADSHEVLSRHLASLAHRALQAVSGQGTERLVRQVEMTNAIAEAIAAGSPRMVQDEDRLELTHDLLTAIVPRPPAPQTVAFPTRPETPLSAGALLTNGRGQPRIGTEVAREMASADEVDLL